MIDDDNITEASAFPLAFGIAYKKSTVANYKRFWKKSPQDFRSAFLSLGDDPKASWKNF
ncbi:hypothetical protein CPB83DRAFT_777751, partial [Crepidotus variabilis]